MNNNEINLTDYFEISDCYITIIGKPKSNILELISHKVINLQNIIIHEIETNTDEFGNYSGKIRGKFYERVELDKNIKRS